MNPKLITCTSLAEVSKVLLVGVEVGWDVVGVGVGLNVGFGVGDVGCAEGA